MASLADLPLRTPATITEVAGPRAFRRRLLEMGLVPGTEVRVIGVAPFGCPLELALRDGRMSIRRVEAARVAVAR